MTDPYTGPAPVGPRYHVPAAGELRHPLDPDVQTSTKAGAVLFLGVVSVLTMLCVGGVVTAVLGLVIGRVAQAEIAASQGFLGGGRMLRAGIVLCWIAVAVSAAVFVSGLVYILVKAGADTGPDFGDDVN